jgi:hypothetical protein
MHMLTDIKLCQGDHGDASFSSPWDFPIRVITLVGFGVGDDGVLQIGVWGISTSPYSICAASPAAAQFSVSLNILGKLFSVIPKFL